MGLAYHRFAMTNPQRYQLIFGTASPQSLLEVRADVTVTGSTTTRPEWAVTFEALHTVVREMIAAGRIRDDGSLIMAARLWTLTHGAVTLEMAGYFGHDGHGLTEILGPLALDTLVGMGDDRDKAMQSLAPRWSWSRRRRVSKSGRQLVSAQRGESDRSRRGSGTARSAFRLAAFCRCVHLYSAALHRPWPC